MMNEQKFWYELQQLIYRSGVEQAQAERIAQLAVNPTIPAQLIIQTICQGPVYLTERSRLNIPTIYPEVPLSTSQQSALEMALSNSAIALIAGSAATGKTRIATTLVAAIKQQKRVLILTHHHSALNAYRLSSYLSLTQTADHDWLIEHLRRQHLAQPQMDYLPLHLLPDQELTKLRIPAKLETWLPIIQTVSLEQLVKKLSSEFPNLTAARLQLLAYRLKQLEPLLKQQLSLSQLYTNLSDSAVIQLTQQISEYSQIPVIGTISECMRSHHQLWQNPFDLVIVEQAHYLTWCELLFLSSLGHKLVLFGETYLRKTNKNSTQQSFFTRFPQCFDWLEKNLLPAYCCRLLEQFRLHPAVGSPVYQSITDRWILNQRMSDYTILQLKQRLVWHDVPSQFITEEVIRFITNFNPQISSQIGIITFNSQDRDWLIANRPSQFMDVFIGSIADWQGNERAIAIVCCSDSTMPLEDISIALTRGQEYLILFGDYSFWQQPNSPLRPLLLRPELYKERAVVLS